MDVIASQPIACAEVRKARPVITAHTFSRGKPQPSFAVFGNITDIAGRQTLAYRVKAEVPVVIFSCADGCSYPQVGSLVDIKTPDHPADRSIPDSEGSQRFSIEMKQAIVGGKPETL